MNLQATVLAAIETAKQAAGDLLITCSHRQKTGATYTNGHNTPTYATGVDVEGLFDKFSEFEMDGVQVKVTDTKLVLFVNPDSVIPTMGDLINANSIEYQVIKPYPVYAGDKLALCTVHVRS